MSVLLHVSIALSSMLVTSWLFFAPSRQKLYASYGLVGLTLLSGTYLVVSTHSQLLPACTSGLIYLGAVSFCIIASHRKLLAKETSKTS